MTGTAHWTGEQSVGFSTLEGLRFEPGQTREDLSDEHLDALEAVAGMEVTRGQAAAAPAQDTSPETPPAPDTSTPMPALASDAPANSPENTTTG